MTTDTTPTDTDATLDAAAACCTRADAAVCCERTEKERCCGAPQAGALPEPPRGGCGCR